jgi:transposase
MRDKDLYARILQLSEPWKVVDVQVNDREQQVVIRVEARGRLFPCPSCGVPSRRYDHRLRRWRHLDTCQYRTIIEAPLPRVECSEHGVLQIEAPWAEPGARFTALLEALAIDWLLEASLTAVARRLSLSWDELDGIQRRAVRRGLARRSRVTATTLGVDETSFQKRHEYVTVVSDLEKSCVLYVADDRKQTSLDAFWQQLSEEQLAAIKAVAMDMWQPYIRSTEEHIPAAKDKIAFDKFHVARHLGDAVDKVRRQEHRALWKTGDETLKGSRYLWLQNPNTLSDESWVSLNVLRQMALKTARAWSIKEMAMNLWHYVRRGWARRAWKSWIAWAVRSRLEPMRQVARMIRKHLDGILNGIVLNVTNAGSESVNAKIQKVKRLACGFRNRERFRTAIYFHCGGLDLYPDAIHATHTKP